MATFVVAHGAWSAGWAWKKMRPLMRARGHEFFTPTYTGMGERAHLAHKDIDLDTHIADQWTEGRLRLDSLLGLIKKLRASLEQEVETLRRLDHSDPLYEREARNNVAPALRRFTFDKHLRDECRVLVPLLQFCAQDLAETQGLDMTQKLSVLAEIQAAIESVDRD